MKKPIENAVATEFGWVNPKTGELLVSCRGLPNQVPWRRGTKLDSNSSILTDSEVPVNTLIEEVLEHDTQAIEEEKQQAITKKDSGKKKK